MTRVLIRPKRRIEPSRNSPNGQGDGQRGSPILIEAMLNESHSASAEITSHPVEDGLQVTDFIRSAPKGIEIEAAFSNQPMCAGTDSEPDGIFSGDSQTRISAAWDAFLNLIDGRPRREIFQVSTGLKLYDNMALESVSTSQDVNNPDSVVIRARFIEVRVVRSSYTTVPDRLLRDGEAQQRGSGDSHQGEQNAEDVMDCVHCEALCAKYCPNPNYDPDDPSAGGEYKVTADCIEDIDDRVGLKATAGNQAASIALQKSICAKLSKSPGYVSDIGFQRLPDPGR